MWVLMVPTSYGRNTPPAFSRPVGGSTGSYMGTALSTWPPATGQAHPRPRVPALRMARNLHRGREDARKKMHRLRGGRVLMGGCLGGKGQGRSPQGFRVREFQAKGKSSCKHKHLCPSHPFFDAKKKERKSPIALKYLLNKVLL